VLCVTPLGVPAYCHSKQQRDYGRERCFHAMSVGQHSG
jgi:hypothetical protein